MSDIVAFDGTIVSYRHTQQAMDAAARARARWEDSRDALDLAGEMLEAAGAIGASGNTLFHYPTNSGAVRDARVAARKILRICDRIEELAT